MDHSTPHAPTLNGVPHLGRAEAVLYVLLVYLFNYIHPPYQCYIDALAQHEALTQICRRAEFVDRYTGFHQTLETSRPLWGETDLPDVYFALIYAIRIRRSCRWAALAGARYTHQIFPALEPD